VSNFFYQREQVIGEKLLPPAIAQGFHLQLRAESNEGAIKLPGVSMRHGEKARRLRDLHLTSSSTAGPWPR
jgi:hypothetical protein